MGALMAQKVDTTSRLEKLRELMRKPENKVNAYIVPSEDSRMYIIPCIVTDPEEWPFYRLERIQRCL